MAITLDAIEYPPGSGTYISIGSGTDYSGRFLASNPYGGLTGSPIEFTRPGTSPSFQSISIGNRQIPVTFSRDTSGGTTNANFHANLFKWFNPEARASDGDTTRYLRVTWHDGSTTLRIPVNVVSVQVRPGFTELLDVVVQATWPYFEKTTAETQITLSASATNGGNVDAPVLFTFEEGLSPSGAWRFAITDTSGDGVANVPVLLDIGAASITTAADAYVFDQNGNSKKFAVTSSRYIWTICSVGPSETVNYYVVNHSSFDNPDGGDLDWGTFYQSNTSNTSQESDGFLIGDNPARTGVWQPTKLAFVGGGGSNWGFEETEGATDIVFTIKADANDARNDANGMDIVTGIPADSITGLSRVTASHATDIRSFVRYRKAHSAHWEDAWTQTGNGTVTTTITLVDAVEVAVGIEASGSGPTDGATLTLSGTGTPDITVNLDTTKDLTVSRTDIDADTWILNGTVTNSATGQTITFDDLIYYDTTVTSTVYLDFRHDATRRMYTGSTSGIILGKPEAISFSDPIRGIVLRPGSNSMSDTLSGTVPQNVRVDWRNTYG